MMGIDTGKNLLHVIDLAFPRCWPESADLTARFFSESRNHREKTPPFVKP
jgi:hypothetical protein